MPCREEHKRSERANGLNLRRVLGLGSRAATVSTVGVARELDDLGVRQLQDLLELLADVREHLLALLGRPALAARNIAIATVGDALADSAGPGTDTVEALSDIDHDTHELSVALLLEGLADGSEHDVQPEVIDGDGALLLERVRPFSAVLVLLVLPLRSDAGLEQVVVGFEGQLRDGSDVVLDIRSVATRAEDK